MRKLFLHFFSLLCLLLPNFSFALDTALKGFIALDALNYEKVERRKGAAVIGIGVLDLKVFAEQDYMSAAIKLDLDNSKLGEKNNIFEEAYASYRGIKGWRFSLGKGIVKFQNLHWGVIENSFLDGGSVIGTENGWRKVSRKNFISATYGNRGVGWANTFTVFGDSTEVKTDENGNPLLTTTGGGTGATPATAIKVTGYTTENVPAFNTEKEQGFANKLELYREGRWTLTAGQIYYRNKWSPQSSYAVDFGATRDADDIEYWLDVMYGVMSTGPFESYATYRKEEYFIQMGTQYHIDEKWSWVANTEFTRVKDQSHDMTAFVGADGKYYQGDRNNRFGQTVVTKNFKIETGAQYNLTKSAFLTMGVLYERKLAELNGVKDLTNIRNVFNPNADAYKAATTVSFWF